MNLKIAISFGTPRASFDVIEATIIEKYFSDTDRGGASSRDVARLCDIIAPRMPYTWEMYFSKKKKKKLLSYRARLRTARPIDAAKSSR